MSTQIPAVGLFSNMKEDDRELLASYGEFVPVQPGGLLIREGDLQPYLYCVVSGELEVRRDSGGSAFVIGTLYPGESIGEMAIADHTPASATVTATQFSQVWRVSYDQFMDFVAANPTASVQLLLTLLITLSRRLRQVDPSAFRFVEKAA